MLLSTEHAHRMRLHDTYTVIIVDDKARKIVAFSMNKTIAVRMNVPVQTARHTHLKSARKHSLPKISAHSRFIKTKDTYCNGPYLVMSVCQERTVRSMDGNNITFSRIAMNFCYCP